MNAGELRHRVTIQRLTKAVGENLVTKYTFLDVKTVWAKVNNLYGKEFWSAKEFAAENTVEFTMRYDSVKAATMDGRGEISVKDRLVFRGKVYNITSIDNGLYKDAYIKIKGMAVELGENNGS